MTRLPLLLASLIIGVAQAANPQPELQKRVRAATFEVVVPKPAEGSVQYERPPPLELLPYSERTDKYWSVGTAFCIAPNTYVTASHVLSAAVGGQGGPPALRAANGDIFKIVSVQKFYMHQDFAVFTADKPCSGAPLETSDDTAIDTVVFAVGNALGEGIVIRDGLLTSLTPEEQDGRWKWLRYSAATSPGNSGGPLLNEKGQVIGVVIGKSPSENLNYALPISLVVAGENIASSDSRFSMSLPVLKDNYTAAFQMKFPLPLPLAAFDARLESATLEVYKGQRTKFLARYDTELFPRGKSAKLLASVTAAYCPALVSQDKDRSWQVNLSERDDTDLPDEGKVRTRDSSSFTLFQIERGKGAADAKFYTDSRGFMDLLLKGLPINRYVGSEEVKVTSLGAALSDSEVRDRYQRRWRLRTYALPYVDAHLVTLSLPTPDGAVGMVQYVERSGLKVAYDYLGFMADYVYVSYSGTLAQWKGFLGRRDALPPAIAAIAIERDTGNAIHIRSPGVDFDLPAGAMKVGDETSVQVQMTFGENAGKSTWQVGAIYVTQNEDQDIYVGAIRQPKPAKEAGKEITDRWTNMLARTEEFNGERGHDADYRKLWRRASVGSGAKSTQPPSPDAKVLYEVVSVVSNSRLTRDVDTLHDRLMENLKVKE